jgi:hypothetical protein
MNPPAKAEMVLVYDLRRDRRYREQILSGVQDQWEAYLRGERPRGRREKRVARARAGKKNSCGIFCVGFSEIF